MCHFTTIARLEHKVMKILYNKLVQARLLQLQRKQVTVKYFFFFLLVIFTRNNNNKNYKKKTKKNFWVATFLVSGDTHVHNNQAAFIISACIRVI